MESLNAIAPALIATDKVTEGPNSTPNLIPMGHYGEVDDVASVAVMLATNDYTTGQTHQFFSNLRFCHVIFCVPVLTPLTITLTRQLARFYPKPLIVSASEITLPAYSVT